MKRHAIKGQLDREGWGNAAALLLGRHLSFNHHHEICWLLWLILACRLPHEEQMIEELAKTKNSHVLAMLIGAHMEGLIDRRPSIGFGNRLSSVDEHWLHSLVARATTYTKASFGGNLAGEFEHLAEKNVRLINFKKHLKSVASTNKEAISRSKYGYDVEEDLDHQWDGFEDDI